MASAPKDTAVYATKATYHDTSQRADHGEFGFGRLCHVSKANSENSVVFHIPGHAAE